MGKNDMSATSRSFMNERTDYIEETPRTRIPPRQVNKSREKKSISTLNM